MTSVTIRPLTPAEIEAYAEEDAEAERHQEQPQEQSFDTTALNILLGNGG